VSPAAQTVAGLLLPIELENITIGFVGPGQTIRRGIRLIEILPDCLLTLPIVVIAPQFLKNKRAPQLLP
jgi:hypothetical protein